MSVPGKVNPQAANPPDSEHDCVVNPGTPLITSFGPGAAIMLFSHVTFVSIDPPYTLPPLIATAVLWSNCCVFG
jgi:hypothetical protein